MNTTQGQEPARRRPLETLSTTLWVRDAGSPLTCPACDRRANFDLTDTGALTEVDRDEDGPIYAAWCAVDGPFRYQLED